MLQILDEKKSLSTIPIADDYWKENSTNLAGGWLNRVQVFQWIDGFLRITENPIDRLFFFYDFPEHLIILL